MRPSATSTADSRGAQSAPSASVARRSSSAVTIRVATMADLDAVVELRLQLIRESTPNAIYSRVRPDATERARKLYGSQLQSDRECVFLAERGGEIVGIIRCVESAGSPLLYPERYCYIGSAYVKPAVRRRGILRRLLAAAEAWCEERGLDEMRLHSVAESDISNRTWAALGFGVAEHVRLRRLGR